MMANFHWLYSWKRGLRSNWIHHAYVNYGAVALVAEWLQSFKGFPPRQKPASFNLDEVMRQVSSPGPGED
jgi:hypothetical protein